MIALLTAMVCARIVLAGASFVLGLALAVVGVAVELAYVTLCWVVSPIAAGVWWATKRVLGDASVRSVPRALAARPRHRWRHRGRRAARPPTDHLPARQRAVLAGVRAARI